MGLKNVKDVEFIATSFAVPERVVTNDQLASFMDTSDEWISKRTGIRRRHISTEENTSSLAFHAVEKLQEKSNFSPDEIDLIIVATMSPDNMTPSTAAMVQGMLGAKNAVAFDLSAACSGFSYAISVARNILLSNHWHKAIVIGAEVLSKLIDWHDRLTAVLFGDGAGAALLSVSNDQHLLGQDLKTFGNMGNKLTAGHTKPKKDLLENDRKMSAFEMDGREVYRFATHQVPKSILLAAQQANVNLDEIDHFLLHQANERIIKQVAKKLDQPLSKFPMNIAEYGNTAAASEAILLAECVANKVIKKGDLAAMSGFGGGLTVATLIFKF